MENILNFVRNEISVKTIQLCYCISKVVIGYVEMNEH